MLQRYGLLGSLRLFISLLYTKLFYPKARLIRLPFDIRNRKYISLGKDFTTGFGCRIEAIKISAFNSPKLFFGNGIQINDYVHIACGESIIIEDDVLIASKVFITDINHGSYNSKNDYQDSPFNVPKDRKLFTKPVYIEANVWLGENVCVMPGVRIGFGSIVGAGSIVVKNIPPYSIAVGNPAKVIKRFDLETKYWEYFKD
jgi:acetyltransferase-like isoleucine patch superfamily enzyme